MKNRAAELKSYIEPVIGRTDWPWPWESIEEYMQHLAKSPASENVSTYVAHGALRISVMGFENRPATKDELDRMKRLLETA